jgi:hypothetical protein
VPARYLVLVGAPASGAYGPQTGFRPPGSRRQVSPALHVLWPTTPIPQQTWPVPPHGWHDPGLPPPPPPVQVIPALHDSGGYAQHASFKPPQATQLVLAQRVRAAVQIACGMARQHP